MAWSGLELKAWKGAGPRSDSFVDITTGGTTNYGGGIRGGAAAAAAVGVLSRLRVEFRNRWRSEAAELIS